MSKSSIVTLDRQANRKSAGIVEGLAAQVDEKLYEVQDLALCTFVDGLIESIPSGSLPEIPDVGTWKPLATTLKNNASRCKTNVKAFTSLLKTLRTKEREFDRLYTRYVTAKKVGIAPVAKPARVHTQPHVQDDLTMPALNARYLPKPGLSAGVARWMAEYLNFCARWAGRGYEGHYEVSGIWLLATIAASRVGFHDGEISHTPTYAAIVAPSSVWGKTTTAKLSTRILRQAGLSWLLGSNSTSPEKLISNMAGKMLPSNFDRMTLEEQELERLRLAHPGQIGWYYSELGQLISEMSNDKGRNAAFKAFLQRMDDGENEYVSDTFRREREVIERPYLSLLGTMTPTCMAPYSGTGADSWSNGLYARFTFACPAPNMLKTRDQLKAECKPDEVMRIPDSLIRPFVEWNQRLGIRHCQIVDERDDKGKVTGYSIERGAFPEIVYSFAPGAKDMLEDYGIEVLCMAQEQRLAQLESCYARQRDKAQRVAALVASLDDEQDRRVIECKHVAYAIEYAERRRQDLHNLTAHLNYSASENATRELEDLVLNTLAKSDEPMTVREMGRHSRPISKADSDQVLAPILQRLVESGDLTMQKIRQRKAYALSEVE